MIRALDRSNLAVNRLTSAVNAAVNGAQTGQRAQGNDGGVVTTLARESLRRQQNWAVLYLLLYIAALIVGASGAVGLTNALVTSVLERRREIGMLRALGATGGRVAEVFWTEGLILSGVAWMVSAVLGLPLAYAFVRQLRQTVLPVTFIVDATAFLVMLGAMLTIAALASTLAVARASQMRIGDILRYD